MRVLVMWMDNYERVYGGVERVEEDRGSREITLWGATGNRTVIPMRNVRYTEVS